MTDIDPCPKCKKQNGFTWHWGHNDGKGEGYADVKGVVLS